MNEYAISASGLVKRFRSTTALAGVDLHVPLGTIRGVLGPNGAGKTTTVRILSTLLRPDAGSARVGGFDVVRQAHRARALIGLTGQYASVDEELTGTENLILIARLLEQSRREARRRAAELLDQFGLTEAAGRPVRTYSGGMRRRLDLAASMVGRPTMLYLDEPTTGLDPHARNEVWALVRGLAENGVTVLLTTQYLEEADQLADQITVIDHGRVVADGTPTELKAKVSGQRLEVRPANPAELPAVATLVARLTGATPVTEGGIVTVPVADTGALATAVRELDMAGIAVLELSLRLPSLDEVFLGLTGHRVESTPANHPNEPDDRPRTPEPSDRPGTQRTGALG